MIGGCKRYLSSIVHLREQSRPGLALEPPFSHYKLLGKKVSTRGEWETSKPAQPRVKPGLWAAWDWIPCDVANFAR